MMGSVVQFFDLSAWGGPLGIDEFVHAPFWIAVLEIFLINLLLSGDNALVIALACRGLPPHRKFWGVVIGAAVAIVLRLVFTAVIARLMMVPYLKLAGGLALLYIAASLLVPEDDGDGVKAAGNLWRAVQIIAVADLVMSFDNTLAIAAIANGDIVLLGIGLTISIPLIIAGATLIGI